MMESLLGKRYGKLIVIEDNGKDLRVKVECDCGNQGVRSKYSLIKGFAQSCGCVELPGTRTGKKSMLGNRYGSLTVIEDDLGKYVKVECDCGLINSMVRYTLKNTRPKVCMCKARKPEIIQGNRYGTLVVIEDTRKPSVIVQCDCGTIKGVSRYSLLSGCIKSCGCQQYKSRKKSQKKPQKGELRGDRNELVGQQFGMVKVLRRAKEIKSKIFQYECLCLCCNNTFFINRIELMAKRSYACECQKLEVWDY